MKQVILFGGTFDPPHVGHLTMAQLALEQRAADELWFLPAPVPPHKQDAVHDAFELRVEMVERLIRGMARIKVCTIEANLPKPSFTVDTVRACKSRFLDCEFVFLIGSDSLAQLPSWRSADELTREIHFLVAARTGYPFEQTLRWAQATLPALSASLVDMPLLDVSSTWIRDRVHAGLPVCGLAPQAVLEVWSRRSSVDLGNQRDGERL